MTELQGGKPTAERQEPSAESDLCEAKTRPRTDALDPALSFTVLLAENAVVLEDVGSRPGVGDGGFEPAISAV